jgi:hypothetical protein
MKTRLGLVIAVAVLGFAVPASADTVSNFTLDGVTFSDGGTATGGFTLDLTTGALSNINITTSTDNLFGATYTGGNGLFGSTGFTNSPASFSFADFELIYEADLVINLGSALTPSNLASPNTFSIASGSEGVFFIACPEPTFFCGSRTITSGSLDETPATTPLPAALPLFAGGLGALGLLGWRRKKTATLAT